MDWLVSVSKALGEYPQWVKVASIGWLFATAALIAILVLAPHTTSPASESTPPIAIPKATGSTGDRVIDDAIRRIAEVKAKQPVDESALRDAMQPLFSRPAFYGVREESFPMFLFVLCRTRLLLEENIQYFKTTPRVRSELGRTAQLMVQLQNKVASIYGPTFSVTRHIADHISNRDEFIRNLPTQVFEPDPQFFAERDKEVGLIRRALNGIGFANF